MKNIIIIFFAVESFLVARQEKFKTNLHFVSFFACLELDSSSSG